MQCAQFVTLKLLRAYKWAISPMLPAACRYVPTCSEYAMEAVERYGALRGGWMALGRVLRCHPFAGAGYDPVVRRTMDEPLQKGERTHRELETVI
ncbi:MAG TPA: membrane protein insertion efficiency factor YidD [Candidatus Acidoferrales bacterium]|nr:membrane protein insertion efficiency factor YidD [Candidatus Acidoferrales bacterium]